MLAIVTFSKPNLLLLDEPTNHLDLEMRQALAVALQDYAGAVVVVSHDRHLLRTVVDQFYVVHSGRAQPFDGDLEDYAQWLAAQVTAAAPSEASHSDSAEGRRQRRRDDAQRRALLSPLKAQLAKLEAQLDALARETRQVQAALATTEIYADAQKARLRELLEKQTQLARDTERVEAAWLAGGEELEALQKSLADPVA